MSMLKLGERGLNFQNTGDIEMIVYSSDTGMSTLRSRCLHGRSPEKGVLGCWLKAEVLDQTQVPTSTRGEYYGESALLCLFASGKPRAPDHSRPTSATEEFKT